MLMSTDQWDWKLNAPEFVPGNINVGGPGDMVPPMQGGLPDGGPGPVHPGFAGPFSTPATFGPVGAVAASGMLCSSGLGPLFGGGPGMQGNAGQMQGGPGQMQGDGPGPPPVSVGGPTFSAGLPPPPRPSGLPAFMGPSVQPVSGLHGPQNAAPPQGGGMPGRGQGIGFDDPGSFGQMRAHYEWQMQVKDHKLRDLQKRLGREEVERMQMQAEFERDRDGLLQHVNKLAAAVEKAGITIDGKAKSPHPNAGLQMGNGPGGQFVPPQRKGLESNMEKLNSLLQGRSEDAAPSRGKGNNFKNFPGPRPGASSASNMPHTGQTHSAGRGGPLPQGGSTSSRRVLGDRTGPSNTLRTHGGDAGAPSRSDPPVGSMKAPHGKPAAPIERSARDREGGRDTAWSSSSAPSREIRNAPVGTARDAPTDAALAEEVERALRAVQRCAGEPLSDEARQAVEALATGPGGISAVRQAVRRVEELAQARTGRCADFTAELQAVCRKIRRRFQQHPSETSASASRPAAPEALPSQAERQAERAGHSERRHGANVMPGSGREGRDMRDQRAPLKGPRERLDRRIGTGERNSHWSAARFEKLTKLGAFELRRRDDGSGTWELQISMSELEPPLTDEGMQVFCRWFHGRMAKVKEQVGQVPLRDIVTEVNFSRNGLGDEAIGRLLQAMQRSELQITCLNLFANRIGSVGARYIADFLWSASSPVQELHLSHNELDEESALEILRLLAEHPRYPPKISCGPVGAAVGTSRETQFPVWLRLNNNWIKDPAKVVKLAENELGVCVCLARNRHTCGPRKCGRRGGGGAACPLVHLYAFDTQESPPDCPQPSQPASSELAPSSSSASAANATSAATAVEERSAPARRTAAYGQGLSERGPGRGFGPNSTPAIVGVNTPISIASSALSRRTNAASETDLGPDAAVAKTPTISQIMVAPGRDSSSSMAAAVEDCDMADLGGVPEQTPEPDELGSSTSSTAALPVERPREQPQSEQVDDAQASHATEVVSTPATRHPLPPAPTEDPPEPPARPRLTAPPRILRREAPPAPEAPSTTPPA